MKTIIFGDNYLSEIIREYISKDEKREIVGITLDKAYIPKGNNHIIPFEEIEKAFLPAEHEILVCIGYKNMNGLRKEKILEAKEKGFKIASFIHPEAKIMNNVKIGEGNIIFDNVYIGSFAEVGNGNIIWAGGHIEHHGQIGDYNFIASNSVINGAVKIGNNCFIGSNSTIKNEIVINDYTLVGAGAYISKSTEAHSVWVPNRSICLEEKKSTDFF